MTPATRPDLVVCDGCGAAYRRPALAPGQVAQCRRCGNHLGRGHALGIDEQLALAVTALVVFAIANVTTIVELGLGDRYTDATLLESIDAIWDEGQRLIAALAFATAFAFPLALVLLRLYVLAPLAAGVRPPGFAWAMRSLNVATRWSMVEVFMMGTLISYVRSAELAEASPGAGLFAFGALTILLTAHRAAGVHALWHRWSELPE